MNSRAFTIEIDETRLARSKCGKITGDIWISIADQFFPAQGWNDFIVVILNWWIESARNLLH